LFDNLKFKSVENAAEDEQDDNLWVPDSLRAYLDHLAGKLGEKYIRQIFPKFQKIECSMWTGVDSGSLHWHNDWKDKQGMNSNILLYLDSLSEKTGGALHVRGPLSEKTIYPRRGLFVWLNQSPRFLHKADRTSSQRRIVGFDYHIEDLVK
jgi:hypothetical protein